MRKLKITELNRLTADEYKTVAKLPVVVVLDEVRSLNNVGSVFRTADAFRMEAVYLCGITATPPSAEIHKTALGAEETVEWRYYKDTADAVAELKRQGYMLCALEQAEGSISLQDLSLDINQKYAIVVGHEVKGVRQAVVDTCDMCIEIPQCGTKHSLNVSVATGMVLWEIFKQLDRPTLH
ncbi:RNA methyltransferase [Tannerella forsythia]|uniref:RNA methyltransferase n=1 Tax=Tannerella forsythia TaxID=28112 RepID=UPI000BE74771|nr:RNA methyltransferase [Tannerella forsythia]PDP70148.1 RNA methyltransferase [Tannerella forsythia]